MQRVHGILQYFPASRLTTHRSAHQHVTMPCILAIIELNHFFNLLRFHYEPCSFGFDLKSFNKILIDHLLHFDVGEQIIEK